MALTRPSVSFGSKRVILCEQSISNLFDKKGQMNQSRFISLLVAGSHAIEAKDGKKSRKGSGFAWGQDQKIFRTACTLLNQKARLGERNHCIGKYLYNNNVFTFLLTGFLMNCEDAKLSRNKKTKTAATKNTTKSVQERMCDIFEGCMLVRLLPIMERCEIEADEDYVRRLAMSNWFDIIAPPKKRVAMGQQQEGQEEVRSTDTDYLDSGILSLNELKKLFATVFTNSFPGHTPSEEEITSAIELLDVDANGEISKTEFLMFINRILLTRHTCTSYKKSRSRDLSHRVRRALLLESERRMEIVYQFRSVLHTLFGRFSTLRDAATEKLLNVPLLDETQAALLFDELGDGNTCGEQGVKLAREMFQWCWPLYQDPPPSFNEINFISHGIELLLCLDVAFHPDITKCLKLKVVKELKRRNDHSNFNLGASFRKFALLNTETTDRLNPDLFNKMMMKHMVSFDSNEIKSLFAFMNGSNKKKRRITDQESPKRTNRIKEKAFVSYMSRGLRLSYEHRLIFSQRSAIHQKVHQFLVSIINKEKNRELKLNNLFSLVDKDGSGMIHATALHELMRNYLPEDTKAAGKGVKDILFFIFSYFSVWI